MRALLGLALLVALAAPVLGHDAFREPAHTQVWCWGNAPAVVVCDMGEHVALAPGSHQFAWQSAPHPTTASIESRWTWTDAAGLVHEGWERIDVADGRVVRGAVFQTSQGGEPVPSSGIPYRVVCRSFDLGTTTPGGVGAFACSHRHDELTSLG